MKSMRKSKAMLRLEQKEDYHLRITKEQLGHLFHAICETTRELERSNDPSQAEPFEKLMYALQEQAEEDDDRTMNGDIVSYRVWAMPAKYTFTIRPIQTLLRRYVDIDRQLWIDPFAGFHSPCRETNDLNPASPAKHHLQAVEFVRRYEQIDGVLFDPPYSPRQIAECYQSAGLVVSAEATQNARLYKEVRQEIAKRMRVGGVAISFGWNSTGFGETLGFKKIEVMHVAHGAAHNDTIVVVEVKTG